MSSPSPSEPLRRIDWDAATPGTWTLAAVLVVVHVVGSVWLWALGNVGLVDVLFLDRAVQVRVDLGGQYAPLVDQGEWWRLLTSVLLHADILHLLVNTVALLALGRILEPWLGWARVGSIFALGGVVGSITSHLAGHVQSDGASGAAFALFGVAVVLGLRWRQDFDAEDQRLLGPILWVFLVANVVLSFVLPFVDAVGHLGGLGAGIVLGAAIRGRGGIADVFVLALYGVGCVWGWWGWLLVQALE